MRILAILLALTVSLVPIGFASRDLALAFISSGFAYNPSPLVRYIKTLRGAGSDADVCFIFIPIPGQGGYDPQKPSTWQVRIWLYFI